ncbi:winged helix-turn-helix domain-containing protein [Gemella cuniculi]|uniref:winged helix-turn-helix domain-containing protein n=1 Tax=Gemella cuniculi TaxID=150240 RepID=UPI0024818DF1|nr:winged helix-turn-helix domain-containing protein [Gemella cuniculi]
MIFGNIKILKFFLNNVNKAVTRDTILDAVWKDKDDIPFDRIIDSYVKNLRKKLGLDCIVTIKNVGYKMSL